MRIRVDWIAYDGPYRKGPVTEGAQVAHHVFAEYEARYPDMINGVVEGAFITSAERYLAAHGEEKLRQLVEQIINGSKAKDLNGG